MSDPNVVQRVAMKAVIVRDGKVLILREASTYKEGTNHGRYHIPGGRVDPGEHFEVALKREVKEETGLEVEVGMPLYVGEWNPVIRDVPHQIVATFVVCKPLTNKKIVLSEEHDHYEWIDPKRRTDFDIMTPDNLAVDRFAELNEKNIYND